MFDFVRKHTRLLFFFLILLIIPSFVFLGLDGYRRYQDGAKQPVAEVAGVAVTQAEWDAAHRVQVERIRRQMPNVDAALLDGPALRQQSLDGLIRERVLLAAASNQHLVTPDARMLRFFRADPQFAFLRNADGSINKDLLQAQGMSSDQFAQRLRQDLAVAQVMSGVSATALAPAAAASAALDAFFQVREVQVVRFDPKDTSQGIAPSEAELQAYYADPAHAAQFQAAERADIEYIVLDAEAMARSIKVPEDDLHKFYEQNVARFTTPEERRASHILIKAEATAPAAERAKARQKADELHAELTRNPAAFADLARSHSQDPGSAAKGGDLDFFSRGAMVKPFEDAAFQLKPGALSGVVASDFGFHIIRLDAIRGGEKKSFDSVRAELEAEIRRDLAQKKFAEAASDFGNMVYEQSDSLKPAADKFGLAVQQEKNVERKAPPGAVGVLGSDKLRAALFAPEVLRNKRNTDAVEIAPGKLAAARVTQYTAARLLPFSDVREQVRAQVVARQAAARARSEGEARLQALKAAPQTPLEVPVQPVSRTQTQKLPRKLVEAALAAPATALPTHVGVDLGADGYAVLRVVRVVGRDPVAADPATARTEYARAWADAESQAFYGALKTSLGVELKAPATAASAPASAGRAAAR